MPLHWISSLPPELVSFLLASVRVAAVLLLAPPLSSLAIPALARAACVLGLAAAVWPVQPLLPETVGLLALLPIAIQEFVKGAWMALGMSLGFAAFNVGARLLDVQIGFGIGQVLDPSTRLRTPVLSATFTLLAPVVFFTTDSHHLLLRAVAMSVERFPAGAPWPLTDATAMLFGQAQGLLALGLAMVAPVVFCLVLVELALGVVARNLPQMNVFVLGIPIKVISGLGALCAWMVAASMPMHKVFDGVFRGWEAVLR